MAQFNQIIITNDGLELLTKAQTGTALQFSRMAVGDGVLVPGQQLQDLTALINEKQSFSISSVHIDGEGNARVRGVISNNGLLTGFHIKEIGLFANDPVKGEILYCVANAGDLADYLPPGGGAEVVESTMDLIVVIDNAANVTAVIDDSLTYVTVRDYEEDQGTEILMPKNQVKPSINSLLKTFQEIIENDFVITGFDIASTSGLDVTVNPGKAIIKGYQVEESNQKTLTLSDNATNHIYYQLTLDTNGVITGQDFVTNTTGVQPLNSMLIAEITTLSGAVSNQRDKRQMGFKVNEAYNADSADAYKGNDIDADGDGKVNSAVQADNAANADYALSAGRYYRATFGLSSGGAKTLFHHMGGSHLLLPILYITRDDGLTRFAGSDFGFENIDENTIRIHNKSPHYVYMALYLLNLFGE